MCESDRRRNSLGAAKENEQENAREYENMKTMNKIVSCCSSHVEQCERNFPDSQIMVSRLLWQACQLPRRCPSKEHLPFH